MQNNYRLGDILANSITHGVGAALAIAGAAYLIVVSTHGSAWMVVSCSIFASTLVLVYACFAPRSGGVDSLCIVWTLAIAGVIFKSFAVGRFAVASAAVYLFQGWVVIFAARPLMDAISPHGLIWLGAGGLAYMLGIVFFALDRIPYFHAAWHLFVLAGSVAHYFAILFYVVPRRRERGR